MFLNDLTYKEHYNAFISFKKLYFFIIDEKFFIKKRHKNHYYQVFIDYTRIFLLQLYWLNCTTYSFVSSFSFLHTFCWMWFYSIPKYVTKFEIFFLLSPIDYLQLTFSEISLFIFYRLNYINQLTVWNYTHENW